MGSANIVYVSIPDSSATCANLGLPTLPGGWSYQCSTSANYRKTDGTGWIPIAFNTISFGNTLDTLPVDPTNTTSSLNYYTYITGGSFELTAAMESAKYKMGGSNDVSSRDNGLYPELYEMGSNLTLLPVNYGDTSLVGYWKFDEGSGTTAYDASGHGANGTIYGGSTYTTSKVGSYSINLGNGNYVNIPSSTLTTPNTNDFTVGLWIKIPFAAIGTDNSYPNIFLKGLTTGAPAHTWGFIGGSTSTSTVRFQQTSDVGGTFPVNLSTGVLADGWHYLITKRSGSTTQLYVDGIYSTQSTSGGTNLNTTSNFSVGGNSSNGSYFIGQIDDVRIYNRALSAAEVQAMYTATNK